MKTASDKIFLFVLLLAICVMIELHLHLWLTFIAGWIMLVGYVLLVKKMKVLK